MPLGETLVANGIITRQQQERIGEILVRLGYVSGEDLQNYFSGPFPGLDRG